MADNGLRPLSLQASRSPLAFPLVRVLPHPVLRIAGGP